MIALALLLACVHGEPVVAVRPDQIDLAVCGSDETLVAHRMDIVIERPPEAAPVEMRIDKKWSVRLTAKELAALRILRAPATASTLTLHAAHYRDAAAALNGARVSLVLHRNPVIRGRVLSPNGQPVAGASVDPLHCFTQPDGTFACEVDADWPRTLQIAAPSAPAHVVALDRIERDTNLGDVHLSRGANLALRVEAPEQARDVDVTLLRDDVAIAERHVRLPLAEPIAIANIEPGTTRLLVKGSRPFQQRALEVEIKPGDNAQKVSIEESELTLHVRSGTRPEANATITLKSVDGRWAGTTEADASGSAVEPLWQMGTFTAAVRTKTSASPFLDHHEFASGEKQQWTFQLPIGRIEGVVRNENHSPVADAEIGLTTDDGDMTTSLHAKSDAEGRYAFDGVRAGTQTVTGSAEGYLPADAVQFRLVENEDVRRADLTLRSGKQMPLDVVDRRGVPLANATVIVTVENAVSSRAVTDSNGSTTVTVPSSASAVLFVVPASGSFAVHRVTSIDRDASAIHIMVPDGVASLELKTETTEKKPVPQVHFLVRFDGELLPVEVRGVPPFATGSDGSGKIGDLPVGTYELWPAVGPIDLQMSDVSAPLRIALAPGTNSATLTFRTPRR